MNKNKKSKITITNPLRKFSKLYQSRSLTAQLVFTITLIFVSFFGLQILLNAQFFKDYYTEQEYNAVHQDLIDYIVLMNEEDDANLYNEMYDFTSTRNIYSLVLAKNFRVLESSYTDYTITITANEIEYKILMTDVDYDFNINDEYIFTISYYNNEYFTANKIVDANSLAVIYNNNSTSTIDPFTAIVTKVEKPSNLNYQFKDNLVVQLQVSKLAQKEIVLGDNTNSYVVDGIKGYWYTSTEGPVNTLVFIHDLGDFNYILTIIPIVDTDSITAIITSYNYFIYLTAVILITIWSFRLSTIISNPIKKIEEVAKEIANLNFDVEAHEYTNKEAASLSRSINLISKNLKETLESLSTKNDELMQLYSEQSAQVDLKKQLVSSISHELKTPLMIMQVTIQGILDEIIPEEDHLKELENVITEINKSSVMIQDLLQIYRLEDASTALELTDFNLSEATYYFINDFENVIKKYHFNLDIDIEADVFIEADVKLIKRVISNYLTNAIKYTPNKEKISIKIREFENTTIFEVINYGVSLSDEELKNMWIPFHRLERNNTTRLQSKGSGIGLYLVSEILKAHNFEYGITSLENGVKAYFITNKKTMI